jgi:hypothetical protein
LFVGLWTYSQFDRDNLAISKSKVGRRDEPEGGDGLPTSRIILDVFGEAADHSS